mmetsp:Transcript_36670/g.54765  ORF Transcript_36670/g.54765 Transcript_36670/m.54765 type:complete len:89 (+) Transcript_36670:76-342(+)
MSKTRETIRLDPNKYKEYTEKKAAAAAASQSVVSWKTIDESEAQLGTQNRLHKTRESYTSALRHKQNKQKGLRDLVALKVFLLLLILF